MVKVEELDEKLKITVANTGVEIPETIKNDIFEPFKCSDTSRVSKDGSRLGLAITTWVLICILIISICIIHIIMI